LTIIINDAYYLFNGSTQVMKCEIWSHKMLFNLSRHTAECVTVWRRC